MLYQLSYLGEKGGSRVTDCTIGAPRKKMSGRVLGHET